MISSFTSPVACTLFLLAASALASNADMHAKRVHPFPTQGPIIETTLSAIPSRFSPSLYTSDYGTNYWPYLSSSVAGITTRPHPVPQSGSVSTTADGNSGTSTSTDTTTSSSSDSTTSSVAMMSTSTGATTTSMSTSTSATAVSATTSAAGNAAGRTKGGAGVAGLVGLGVALLI